MNPDPGGPKTYGSGSATLHKIVFFFFAFKFNTSLEHNDLQLFRESQRGENYGCHRYEQRQLKVLVHRVDRVLRFFSSRRNLDSPTPSPAGECALPPLWFRAAGRGHTLLRERGGGSQFPTRGQTLWFSIYIPMYLCTLCIGVLPKLGALSQCDTL
jgi:hypothetical protein